MTETWLSPGDFSALKELSPSDCLFNSPRTVGCGAEIATIFNNCFKCKLLPVENFLSFEVQLLRVDLTTSLVFTVIYRPSNFNKDFIQEFSDLLTSLMSHSDRLLILGDFNFHASCQSKPLVKECLRLRDSPNFVQFALFFSD